MNNQKIEQWLDAFHSAWAGHDIPAVMRLLSDDVEYWETPHKLLGSKQELEQEWQAILTQQNIQLKTKVFSATDDGDYAVIWHLRYTRDGQVNESGGTYLIRLNDEGLCTFFHYASAPKV